MPLTIQTHTSSVVLKSDGDLVDEITRQIAEAAAGASDQYAARFPDHNVRLEVYASLNEHFEEFTTVRNGVHIGRISRNTQQPVVATIHYHIAELRNTTSVDRHARIADDFNDAVTQLAASLSSAQ